MGIGFATKELSNETHWVSYYMHFVRFLNQGLLVGHWFLCKLSCSPLSPKIPSQVFLQESCLSTFHNYPISFFYITILLWQIWSISLLLDFTFNQECIKVFGLKLSSIVGSQDVDLHGHFVIHQTPYIFWISHKNLF